MPAPRRRNTLFGFLSKGGKHKKIGGQHEDQEDILSKYEAESNISYQEDNICDDLGSTTNHDRDQDSHHRHPHSSHEDESYGYPNERPEGTEYSTHSLTAKPTTATLGETFSSGTGHDHIHFVDSKDQSDVDNSVFLFSDRPNGGDYNNEYDDYHQQSSYTEFHNATLEDDDAGTLDYTATVRANYHDDHSESHAARHVRVDQYNDADYPEGIEAEWEDGSTGYDDTCSRTLNTNLEGMNYISDAVGGPASYQHSHIQTAFSDDNVDENANEPQYYYQDEDYDLYQESFGAEGYYYDDEGQLVGQSNQDEDGNFFDGGDDQNTLGNSTIATEGLDPSVLGPVIHGPNLSNQLLSPHPEEDIPFDTYESDGTQSSSDDEETRDLSLLDDVDDDEDDDDEEEEDEDDNGPQGNDKGDESDSDSDADSRRKKRGRRLHKPKSFMSIITEMQRCSMKGTSLSYDDDSSDDDSSSDDDDDDDDDDDRDDVPDVAQISTGATSLTSMTDSFHSRTSAAPQDLKKKKLNFKKKSRNNNFDNLFNKVSALGQELLGAEEPQPGRKGKKTSRRRDQDPATRIVESIRDIFSCGHPTNY